MTINHKAPWGLLITTATMLLAVSIAVAEPVQNEGATLRVHYIEIVSDDVAAQCAVLEGTYGVSFGAEVAEFGQARIAEMADGSMIGVRAPLAEHETPITRTYLEVADIKAAVKEAEAAGAMIAYGPIEQADTGTWAIYILGGVQCGLWQR